MIYLYNRDTNLLFLTHMLLPVYHFLKKAFHLVHDLKAYITSSSLDLFMK